MTNNFQHEQQENWYLSSFTKFIHKKPGISDGDGIIGSAWESMYIYIYEWVACMVVDEGYDMIYIING